MQINKIMTWVVLMLCLTARPGVAQERFSVTEWPTSSAGAESEVIQYIDLEFKLPRSMIGRVVVLGTDWPNLAILRNIKNNKYVINFGKMDKFKDTYELFLKKGYFEELGIHDAESFFDALATSPDVLQSEPLKVMRSVMQINNANCTKTSNEIFTVYRVKSNQEAGQMLYVLIDGQDTVYQISGDILDADYIALLSGMALSTVH
jgi:hypothetical protein